MSPHTHTHTQQRNENNYFHDFKWKKNSVIANENAKRIKRADNKGIYFALGLACGAARPNAEGAKKECQPNVAIVRHDETGEN